MDLFDDFEMKPITDGLGFHNRKNSENDIVEEIRKEVPQKPVNKKMGEDQEIEELMSALDRVSNSLDGTMSEASIQEEQSKVGVEEDIEIVEALPRKAMNIEQHQPIAPLINELPPIIEDTPSKITPVAPKQIKKPRVSSVAKPRVGVRRGAADSPVSDLVPAVFSFGSVFLDIIMVLALSLMFLISLLLVTGVKLSMVFNGVQTDLMTQLSMLLLYTAVLQLYVIVSRSFFGRTLGEWTFEFQMGDNHQIRSAVYPVLVLWRSTVIVITGIVTLPFLSIIFRKDLASYLTGLQFYKKR